MSGTPIENAIETLNAQVGQPSQPTDWFEITQERVNTFADATLTSSGFTWIPSVRKRVRLARRLPTVS